MRGITRLAEERDVSKISYRLLLVDINGCHVHPCSLPLIEIRESATVTEH